MKHKAIKLLGLVGATTTATLMGGAQASAITIDNWTTTQNASAAQPSPETASGGGIFGGTRTVNLGGALTGTDNDEVIIQNGTFEFNTGAAGGERTAILSYNDPSGQNFAAAGSGIRFPKVSGFLEDSSGSPGSGFKVTLSDGGSATASANLDARRNNPEEIFFDFQDDFGVGNPSSSFLTSVKDVEISITTPDGGQDPFIEGTAEVTGEPVPFNTQSWIGLAFLGSWGAWKYWQRKRTQQS